MLDCSHLDRLVIGLDADSAQRAFVDRVIPALVDAYTRSSPSPDIVERMAGQPLSAGPFGQLELEAVASPGAPYFTYWRYGCADTQTPNGVDRGLFRPAAAPRINQHAN
jgi:hypothetical protein